MTGTARAHTDGALALEPAAATLPHDWLTSARRRAGLSLAATAARVGVHATTVNRWERLLRTPGPAAARALAETLAVAPDDVVRFVDEHRPEPQPPLGLRGPGLRRLRRAEGLSAEALAAQLHVPAHTVYNWEAGRARIPRTAAPALARALATPPAQLVAELRRPTGTARRPARPLTRLRRRHGLTQAELARRLGVSRQSVRAWERGRVPPPGKLRRLALLLHTDVVSLAQALRVELPGQLRTAAWRPGQRGEALRFLREWSDLGQRDLADRLGVSVTSVRSWERGRAAPSRAARVRLELLYRLPPDALLGL